MAEKAGLSKVQRLTTPRYRSLAARIAEIGGIENWPMVLGKVSGNAFLTGSNKTGWRADFDFVLQQKSFTKLMEGGYDGSNRPAQSDIQRALDDERSRARESGNDLGFP